MKSQFNFAFLLPLAAYVVNSASLSDNPHLLIRTDLGAVQGAWNLDIWNKIGKFFGADPTKHSRYFASIPFAEPPVGDRRFRSPQPLTTAWGHVDANGVINGQIRDASSFPSACPQNFFMAFSQSEDCLYLNVFTPPPMRVQSKKLPVMVFIYGGAFNFGDSYTLGSYNARSLTDSQDVIVITLNHRTNAFGFLYTDEEGGNFGLEDQREALRWIKRNIVNFGGDPDNVTMFGMSSGATSAILHATSPATENGLLHKIIHQSGPLGTVIVSKEEIAQTSLNLAKQLNCVGSNGKPDLSCLRKIPFKDILKAAGPSLNDPSKDPTAGEDFNDDPNQIVNYMGDTYKWWPTLDGRNIVGNPVDLVAQGKHKNIPMIIGVQKDEGGLWFLPFDIPIYGSIRKQKLYNPTSYQDRLKLIFGRDYNTMSQSYPVQPTAEGNVKQLINLITDYAWLCPSEQTALNWAKKNKNTFFYRWTQPTFPPLPRCLDGCCHSNEAPYLFNTIWPLIGSSRQNLASKVQSYWVNFATTGNPNLSSNGGSPPSADLPHWPQYDSQQIHQELGDRVGPENRVRAEFCNALSRMNVTSSSPNSNGLLPTAQVTQAVYVALMPNEEKRKAAFDNQTPGPIRFDPSELESLRELPVF